MTASRHTSYWLASHIHMCRSSGSVVLLDLKRDRYFGMEVAQFNALLPYFDACHPGRLTDLHSDKAPPLLADLVAQGVLIDDADHGTSPGPPAVERPRAALVDGYSDVRVSTRLPELARFCRAALSTAWTLRFRPLNRTIQRFADRRVRADRVRPAECRLEAARRCVAAYSRFRMFFFTSRNECLFNSLALANFLNAHGIFPQLVFGVKLRPFGAHCWLQIGDVVVNDTPEHVRRFDPIMAP